MKNWKEEAGGGGASETGQEQWMYRGAIQFCASLKEDKPLLE